MKKRTITISLIVLAIMLLVGIGYAGWVIASQTSGSAESGNFTAYSVDSSTLTVTDVSGSIVFGYKDSEPAVSNPWLTHPSVAAESLSATFTVSWTNQVAGSTFTLTPEAYRANATTTPVALDSKLIKAPTFSVSSGDASVTGTTLTLNEASGSATITINYGWGTSLSSDGTENPYVFFNSKTKTAAPTPAQQYSSETTYEQLANNALSALNTLIGSGESVLKFRVKVAKSA